MTTEETQKLQDDEIKTLREANQELLEALKYIVQGVHDIQIGPMSDGISRLIASTQNGLDTIKKFDSEFELNFTTPNDKN